MNKLFLNKTITAIIAIIMLLVISLALPCLPAKAAESGPVCWGVFVGVSNLFTSENIIYADDDARALYDTLSPIWGAAHTMELIDSQASRVEILKAVGWLASNAGPNDTVVFTFSGQGAAPSAICPSDFTPWNGGLPASQLADAFAPVKAKRILIVLDSDYSGQFMNSLAKPGRVLMLASTVGERAKESSVYQHGIYTYFILQTLNNFTTYDTNHDYELTIREIAPYASEMTTSVNYEQHPLLYNGVDGEFPLLAKFDFALNMNLPAGTTVLTLDDVAYETQPISQIWVPDTAHTMTVPGTVNVGADTRYIFVGWKDGISSNTRTVFKGSYVANYILEYHLTVYSPLGETTGTGWYNNASSASFLVTSSIETENTRQFFTSWSGDSTSTSPAGSLIMNTPKTVTANWRTEYLLKLDSAYGNPTGAGWYVAGETVNISVEPPPGFFVRQMFNGWSGDITSAEANANLIMDSPKIVFATWRTDYFWLYIVVAIAIVIIVGATTAIIFVYLKRKRKST